MGIAVNLITARWYEIVLRVWHVAEQAKLLQSFPKVAEKISKSMRMKAFSASSDPVLTFKEQHFVA